MRKYLFWLLVAGVGLGYGMYLLGGAGFDILWSAVEVRNREASRARTVQALAAAGQDGAPLSQAQPRADPPALAAPAAPASAPTPPAPLRDEAAVLRIGMSRSALIEGLGAPAHEEEVNGYRYLTYRTYRVVVRAGEVIGWSEYCRAGRR